MHRWKRILPGAKQLLGKNLSAKDRLFPYELLAKKTLRSHKLEGYFNCFCL